MSDILARLQTRITLLRHHHRPSMTIAEIRVLEGAADDLEAAARYIQALEGVEDGLEVAAASDGVASTRGALQDRRTEPVSKAR